MASVKQGVPVVGKTINYLHNSAFLSVRFQRVFTHLVAVTKGQIGIQEMWEDKSTVLAASEFSIC